MDYKEKYEQALEVAQRFYNNSVAITKKGLEDIFPELAESEDERIRKELIAFLKENHETGRADETWSLSGIERWIAWLEKQSKDSPVLSNSSNTGKFSWSEEDERIKESIITGLEMLKDGASDKSLIALYNKKINWLKSLRPQSQWKPSDMELEVLRLAAEKDGTCLIGLYEQLKKLREE